MAPIDGLTLSASYYDFGEMGNKDDNRNKKVVHTQLITQLVKYQLVMVKRYTLQQRE